MRPNRAIAMAVVLAGTILAGSRAAQAVTPPAGSAVAKVGSNPPGCTAPLSAQSQAQCTFDIWGYVTYEDRSPAAGADLTDHVGSNASSAAGGFYDLYEMAPGTYEITAYAPNQPGCEVSRTVDDNAAAALMNGGTHVDLRLPCYPTGQS